MEVLVEHCESGEQTLAAIEASSEKEWLKSALRGAVLMGQAFAVEFELEDDAVMFADRMRRLGFRCQVQDGPSRGQRVKAKPQDG